MAMNRGAPAPTTAMAAALNRARLAPITRVPVTKAMPKTGNDKTTTDDTPAKNSTGEPTTPTHEKAKENEDDKDGKKD